jgi:hypothetical protein
LPSLGRWAVVASIVVVGASSSGGTASAQFGGRGGGFGGGSTVQGDILRGQGMAAWGMGQFNLSTAMANSINTDTAIRWNEYVYQSIKIDLHEKYLHRKAHQEHLNAQEGKTLKRLLETPNQADLRNGDALNFVLMQLIDPRISPSNYRNAVVTLPGETIRKIPFVYSARAATFSMERLIGKREWPLSLRGPEFAPERRNYEKAVDDAIELDVENKLSGQAVREVEKAVRGLDDKIDLVITQDRVNELKQARNHVKKLADIPRILREGPVEKAIAEIETYPGTSVGDLIQFMQRHNLRFGVADSPDETMLYANLYDSFRKQRDQVTLPPDPNSEPIK